MIVKYFAYYREDTGCKEEKISSLAPVAAIDLLKYLCEIHPGLKRRLLDKDDLDIHEDVIFLLDGRNIDFIQGKASLITEDCVVSLFPRIAGG